MKNKKKVIEKISRRSFLGSSAVGLAAFAIASDSIRAGTAGPAASPPATKPNSVFNGVKIGATTYSFRGVRGGNEGFLNAAIGAGLSEVELRDPDLSIEGSSGTADGGRGFGGGQRGSRGGSAAAPLTEAEMQTQRATYYLQLAKALDIRRLFNEAGVNIHCHKLSFGSTEETFNFAASVAKALGAIGITVERTAEDTIKAIAPFADKNQIWIACHNHTGNGPSIDTMDTILQYGKYIGFNFDIGHYVAGTGLSPIPVIEKYHDRIVTLHLKDRTPDGGNLPFGQGKTPIKECLQLIAKEKWPIYCDIELEYQIPQGSDSVKEVAKCVEYCRNCLV
jgi:sugar phosphate isomerase/epimerase